MATSNLQASMLGLVIAFATFLSALTLEGFNSYSCFVPKLPDDAKGVDISFCPDDVKTRVMIANATGTLGFLLLLGAMYVSLCLVLVSELDEHKKIAAIVAAVSALVAAVCIIVSLYLYMTRYDDKVKARPKYLGPSPLRDVDRSLSCCLGFTSAVLAMVCSVLLLLDNCWEK